ncbi:MAG: glutathione S-transferase family protein [Bauldia litoralis]
MLELYNAPQSTCSQKVRLCLWEKGIVYVDRPVNLKEREHVSPEYLALNPNGVVPTLVHDGTPIVESSVIIEYLDEVFPENSLTPADPKQRARMRAWMRYIEEVPTVAIRYPSFNQVLVKGLRALDPDAFAAMAAKNPLRKDFYMRMGQDGFPEADMRASLERLRQTLERMDAALADGPWLVGGDLTLADLCVVPTLDRMEDLGLAPMWDDLPRVADWFARIKARPSYAKTYPEGARLSVAYGEPDPPTAFALPGTDGRG